MNSLSNLYVVSGGMPAGSVRKEDAGQAISDVLKQYMYDLDVPDGLTELGFTEEQIPALVRGALPQKRVLDLAPISSAAEPLAEIYANSFKLY